MQQRLLGGWEGDRERTLHPDAKQQCAERKRCGQNYQCDDEQGDNAGPRSIAYQQHQAAIVLIDEHTRGQTGRHAHSRVDQANNAGQRGRAGEMQGEQRRGDEAQLRAEDRSELA